jgi:hypothetical protein
MTTLANTDPDILQTIELIDDGLGISNLRARALLDIINDLRRQLDETPPREYTNALEADLDHAKNEALEARQALGSIKRMVKAMVEALEAEGGV